MNMISTNKQFAASGAIVGVLGLGAVAGAALAIAAPANAAPSHGHGSGSTSDHTRGPATPSRHARLDLHFRPSRAARLDPLSGSRPVCRRPCRGEHLEQIKHEREMKERRRRFGNNWKQQESE
jgi:hypothetical protein